MENTSIEKPFVVGVDIGGTNTVFGIVDARGNIISSAAIKTKCCETIEEYVDKLCDNLLFTVIFPYYLFLFVISRIVYFRNDISLLI